MEVFILLAVIAALVWFWLDSMRAREAALQRGKSMCAQMNVQLLDQTVHLARLRLGRNARGHIRLRRFYVYEFSIDGEDRWYGIVILLGQRLEYLRMEHPDGPIIQDTSV